MEEIYNKLTKSNFKIVFYNFLKLLSIDLKLFITLILSRHCKTVGFITQIQPNKTFTDKKTLPNFSKITQTSSELARSGLVVD